MILDGDPGPQFAIRGDNRKVAFDDSGAPDGFPVFLLHGTPGSRKGPRPRDSVLHRLGIRLITYDRPGYGDSDRQPGRHVAAAASDVATIADHLNLDRFAVVGRSGGGPHALACAADHNLRQRVTRVAVLVSFAPPDTTDVEWFEGMNADNVRGFGLGAEVSAQVEAEILRRAELVRQDPASLLEQLMHHMTQADKRALNSSALRQIVIETHREGLRSGPWGWVDDVLALRGGWKVDLESIETEVRIWHGADDTFAPASHAAWLANRIPTAEFFVEPGKAHFDAMQEIPRVLRWAAGDGARPTARGAALIGARPAAQ
ncbi:alpha/beta hydrolase [Dactylosporangium sp. AC04546]|uniref:alpha/beta fold hydrolase n=1 Tax=Dactylosporangium sp. AC04546 TaxID=2862460 RepID=UPI001EDD37AC|nr:alpha/beta hydrolase [Dactylosporangium sp. AC04546]WVK84138.1 alpha/beta hydrolase [Dactylosporangium sp. AC04546]